MLKFAIPFWQWRIEKRCGTNGFFKIIVTKKGVRGIPDESEKVWWFE